mmetsp:Transcript_3887/g.4311  ORF Transcript_3887/g.4311 Transcript_3887/m.4311 type:complete len:313 (-) Transcript_3887:273-1211(-)
MEEFISAKKYGGSDASSIYNKQVQEFLIELGGGEEVYGSCEVKKGNPDVVVSADYWGETQQEKMKKETMGFTYLGIAVVHYRLRLICVLTGKRTALLREQMKGSAEDNPRILIVIRRIDTGGVYFLLLFPPKDSHTKYHKRNPLKSCLIDNNLRTNHEFDVMQVSKLKVTEVEGANRGFTSTGSATFYLEDPHVRDRQGHHRIIEVSALLPGHATDINDPGGRIEKMIHDIAGRKAVYQLLRQMVETGSIPPNFPSLSNTVATYDAETESPSSLWNAVTKGEDKNKTADDASTSSTTSSFLSSLPFAGKRSR